MASTMNYKAVDGYLGIPAFTQVDVSQGFEVGTIVKGKDIGASAYGEAEFEYVKFGGTVVAGDFVVIDRGAKSCVQAGTAAIKGVIGVTMGSAVANQFGWVMVRGIHDNANVATGVVAGTPLYLTATAGRPNGTVVAGNKIDCAFERSITSGSVTANIGTVELEWPAWTGNG